MCPSCGGDISSNRLNKALPCEKCLPNEISYKDICQILKKGDFQLLCQIKEELKEFKTIFKETIGNDVWSLQESWAIRYFLKISFAILAPPGIGKSTFGLILSKYIIQKSNSKIYLIFPTQLLVEQAYQKLLSFNVDPSKIVFYHSSYLKSKKEKENIKTKIKNQEFNILITTTNFLYKNIELIPKKIFELIFIDDVDSILKSSKNIDKILSLIGFSKEDIDKVIDFLVLKRKIISKNNPSTNEIELYNQKKEEIKNISKKQKGVLITSSATSIPSYYKSELFRELLGFEIGKPSINIRNITDVYEEVETKKLWNISIGKIKLLGKGGLIFLPSFEKIETLQNYIDYLNQNNIKAISYKDLMKNLSLYKDGKIEVVVGFASYKNPLARGIDLPDTIRYALFIGVPLFKFYIDIETNPIHLYYFLVTITPFLIKKALITQEEISKLTNYINYLNKNRFSIKNNSTNLANIYNFIISIIKREDILKEINSSLEISIQKEENRFLFLVADVRGYIQASGRVSRVYAKGITKGLSYLLVDNQKAFYSLKKRVKFINEEIEFKDISQIDLCSILKEIDKDRELLKKILAHKIIPSSHDLFKTTLIIVESPTKARTIANFFGKALKRRVDELDIYEIMTHNRFLTIVASKGHIFDLNKEEGYFGVIKKDYFIPIFESIDENKKEITKAIRKLNIEIKEVFIATDPDREGEKISYDIYLNIKPYNQNIKRIQFFEVTKEAFIQSIENFRNIDQNLVKAQLLRRVSDRWIGFKISQYLQKSLNNPNLSAGRVQTPTLEWIVNRDKEVRKKISIVQIEINGYKIEFEFLEKKEAKEFFQKINTIKISKIDTKIESKYPKPYTTDQLLADAAKKLKFSPQKSMKIAQELFEEGLITYHRTDSHRISQKGINIAKEYINEHFGSKYFKGRKFDYKQGAHEAIRATKAMDAAELKRMLPIMNFFNITSDHIKLYDLIFKQFIASQMKEAVIENSIYKIKAIEQEKTIEIPTKIIQEGYNLILPIKVYSIIEGLIKINNKKIYSRAKMAPYTFATIIQEMKEKGIGRPSTYAITIEKLLQRRYIIQKKDYLFPTKLGIKVIELIKSKDSIYKFVNEKFTRELEEKMDYIEENKIDYQEELLSLFNKIFNLN